MLMNRLSMSTKKTLNAFRLLMFITGVHYCGFIHNSTDRVASTEKKSIIFKKILAP